MRIRMYRVGFGDCFLLSFPTSGAPEHVLIDCGVHPDGDIGTLPRVVENIALESGGKLALVIATHAHQDHVSGFSRHVDVFRGFEIRQVWLPWTENPRDPVGEQLQQQRTTLGATVRGFVAARPPAPAVAAALANLGDVETALEALRAGFGTAAVTYVDADFSADDAAGIPGLGARVLWPARDQPFAGHMSLDAAALSPAPEADRPFHPSWEVKASTNRYYAAITNDDRNLLADAAARAQGLAFGLDRVANDGSVVVLFTFGGRKLLFGGDAPVSRWAGTLQELDALSFYKVPHHGSSAAHDFVPGAGCAVMVSTQSAPWPTIPMPRLMQALESASSGFIRSDSVPLAGAPVGPALARLPPGFAQGECWFDYLLPLR